MMNWLQGHTKRFKCLASMMGVYDLRSMWAVSYTHLWHLDTQVTTGNHDTIAGINNLVNMINTFLIFNLRDNLDITVVSCLLYTSCTHYQAYRPV